MWLLSACARQLLVLETEANTDVRSRVRAVSEDSNLERFPITWTHSNHFFKYLSNHSIKLL